MLFVIEHYGVAYFKQIISPHDLNLYENKIEVIE